MAQFTVTPLEFDRYKVVGTDDDGNYGETMLVSHSWAAVEHMRKHEIADGIFDEAVREHFAPLVDAANKAKDILASPIDEFRRVGFVVPVEGVDAEDIDLTDEEGIILNILDKGRGDLLLWIKDTLVIKRVV